MYCLFSFQDVYHSTIAYDLQVIFFPISNRVSLIVVVFLLLNQFAQYNDTNFVIVLRQIIAGSITQPNIYFCI
jgi:hypothetical protein